MVSDTAKPVPDLAAMQDKAGEAAEFLKSVASRPRLLILCSLVDRSCLAGELAEELDLAPANLSQHLSRLREEGLVTSKREGNNMRYSLSSDQVRPLIHSLHDIFCGFDPKG